MRKNPKITLSLDFHSLFAIFRFSFITCYLWILIYCYAIFWISFMLCDIWTFHLLLCQIWIFIYYYDIFGFLIVVMDFGFLWAFLRSSLPIAIFSSGPCLDLQCVNDMLEGWVYHPLKPTLYMTWFRFGMIRIFHRNRASSLPTNKRTQKHTNDY